MERARFFTEAYELYEGRVSTPELRALALMHYMENRVLYLGDDELIVGEKADRPQAAPTFPELCCHTDDDLRIMNDRELIPFKVVPEDREFQRQKVMPFWNGRAMRDKILSLMTDEWKACYEAGIFTEFMEQRGPGHTVGSGKIYEKGFLDYQADIDRAIEALDFSSDMDALKKLDELRAMRIACDAIMLLGERYRKLALQKLGVEENPARREELRLIADNLSVVPARKPETFHQAIQMYWFVHLCVTTEINPWDAYSPGRLDQHLFPFYKKDIAAETLTREGALELLECLWVKFNNQPAPPKVGITLKESGTYTDFANINTGGIAPNGACGVNDVSYLILDCMDEMRLLQPSSNVQIDKSTPREFLLRACEIARKGWGQPAFYNTGAIIQELLNAGKTLEDARLGGTSGCVETGAFGNEAYILTGYFNLPKVLEITLNDGLDPRTGKRIGLALFGDEEPTFDELVCAFDRQMRRFIDIKVKGSNAIEQLYMHLMPVPFLSAITNDCIARGCDYNEGGARYNTNYIQGVGIGTMADSLAALRLAVYEDRRISLKALVAAMNRDFEGEVALRAYLVNRAPKYGNDDDRADGLMKRTFNLYDKAVTGRPSPRGAAFRVNMLPTTCHVYFGEVTGATPNGRSAGKPLSEGISPTQGSDTQGPTAALSSAAKMDQLKTGGTLLNQKFSPSVVAGEKGLERMADLIRAYFSLNGHHIQFNVIDRETLQDAQQNPEAHKGLIVRVAGYSDYFANLSRALQDEIIERTQQQ